MILYVLVITRARVPHGRYWHSSDVKPEGRTRRARVITNLLHEQLAKGLLRYCVPKKDAKFLRKAYRVVRLLGHIRQRTSYLISKLTWTEEQLR